MIWCLRLIDLPWIEFSLYLLILLQICCKEVLSCCCCWQAWCYCSFQNAESEALEQLYGDMKGHFASPLWIVGYRAAFAGFAVCNITRCKQTSLCCISASKESCRAQHCPPVSCVLPSSHCTERCLLVVVKSSDCRRVSETFLFIASCVVGPLRVWRFSRLRRWAI